MCLCVFIYIHNSVNIYFSSFYLFINQVSFRFDLAVSCLQWNPVPLWALWSVSVTEGSGLAPAVGSAR